MKRVLIVLGILAALAILIFVWPLPQMRQAVRDARSAEIADSILEATSEPLATEPSEAEVIILQPLPDGVIVENMPKCNQVDRAGSWGEDKKPFEGTQLVCGTDGYWDIITMYYDGIEYQVPVLENVIAEPVPEQVVEGCPARVEIEPPANAFVNADENKTYSFTYVLEEDRPYDIVVPCGSTATIAFGNATINDKAYVASDTEGNVVYSTCDQPLGCKYVVKDFTSGHFIVTMTYPGMEKALDTVYNAVSNMFNPSSCGGSGCLIVFMTDADKSETTATFKSKPAKTDLVVNDFVVEPTTGSVIGEPVTKSITVDGKKVGQVYALESTAVQYIGVPEQHDGFITGLYIECAEGCTIYGTTLKSDESAIVYGNSGDGSSPSDLNWTVAVQSDKPADVKVYFIYADNVDSYAGTPTYKFDSNGLMK